MSSQPYDPVQIRKAASVVEALQEVENRFDVVLRVSDTTFVLNSKEYVIMRNSSTGELGLCFPQADYSHE